MRARCSPSPYEAQDNLHPRPIGTFLRHRIRILYALLTLAGLYLWLQSDIHILPHRNPVHAPSLRYKNVDWSRYAYSQYATNSAYLCNAVMVFEALHRLGSKADRLLFYPQEWDTEISDSKDRDSQLLVKAVRSYNVKLVPVAIPKVAKEKDGWEGGFAKFFAWEQTQYERILHLDSDVTVLKHLDELFLLPSAPVAMLRSYWQLPEKRQLTSLFILLEPDEREFQRLMTASRKDQRSKGDFDMEILNRFYGDSAMVLPHRQYGLISGEFRASQHSKYLGSHYETWNPDLVYREASLVHFSDWPLPKPWVMWPHKLIGEIMPRCKYLESGIVDNCQDRDIWKGLYDDFRKRRKVGLCLELSQQYTDQHKSGRVRLALCPGARVAASQ